MDENMDIALVASHQWVLRKRTLPQRTCSATAATSFPAQIPQLRCVNTRIITCVSIVISTFKSVTILQIAQPEESYMQTVHACTTNNNNNPQRCTKRFPSTASAAAAAAAAPLLWGTWWSMDLYSRAWLGGSKNKRLGATIWGDTIGTMWWYAVYVRCMVYSKSIVGNFRYVHYHSM